MLSLGFQKQQQSHPINHSFNANRLHNSQKARNAAADPAMTSTLTGKGFQGHGTLLQEYQRVDIYIYIKKTHTTLAKKRNVIFLSILREGSQ